MKLGSLFSGAGLGDIGWLMAGFDIRWQVEIDNYCQKVLDLRFPETEKYHDIKTLKGEELEPVDIMAGGFPCQPFSVAGKQRGDQDDRNLWPPMLEVIKKVKPTWVVGENVSGLLNMAKFDIQPEMEDGMPLIKTVGEIYERTGQGYSNIILEELESCGYEVLTFVFPAHALGASHRRERIWIVGYSGLFRQEKYEKQATRTEQSSKNVANPELCGCVHGQAEKQPAKGRVDAQREPEPSGSDVAYSDEPGLSESTQPKQRGICQEKEKSKGCEFSRGESKTFWGDWWSTEPRICRVVNGCPSRVDRLKALGNGQVVACTAFIGQQIMEFEKLIRSQSCQDKN